MSSGSDTSQNENPEAKCMKALTQLDQVINAIKAMGSRKGSTRDEIVDYLVSRDLINAKIAKALVAKALYRGVEEGLIRRPKGANHWLLKTKKRSRRRRRSPKREEDSDQGEPSERRHGHKNHGHHHKGHKHRSHKKS